jgi:hypothetical protein
MLLLLLLLMLGEEQAVEVLILDQGTVKCRPISPHPLASQWRAANWTVITLERGNDTW